MMCKVCLDGDWLQGERDFDKCSYFRMVKRIQNKKKLKHVWRIDSWISFTHKMMDGIGFRDVIYELNQIF